MLARAHMLASTVGTPATMHVHTWAHTATNTDKMLTGAGTGVCAVDQVRGPREESWLELADGALGGCSRVPRGAKGGRWLTPLPARAGYRTFPHCPAGSGTLGAHLAAGIWHHTFLPRLWCELLG